MKKVTIISSVIFIISALLLYFIWMFGTNLGPEGIALIGPIVILVFVALISLIVIVVGIIFTSRYLFLRLIMVVLGTCGAYFLGQSVISIFVGSTGTLQNQQILNTSGIISAFVIGILLLIMAIRRKHA